MRRVLRLVSRLARREEGQDLLEYGLLITLIAVASLAALNTVGNVINTVLWQAIAQNI
jgi:Flp pilus assembly pilin Flp